MHSEYECEFLPDVIEVQRTTIKLSLISRASVLINFGK